MMPTCRPLLLLLLAASLPGQDDRIKEREAEMERRIRERGAQADGTIKEILEKERAERAARGEEMTDEEIEKRQAELMKPLTPEERLARTVQTSAAAFCRFVANVEPKKLMPGQSGVIRVAAVLSGQAVLPSPPPMEMIGSRQQGFVSLGEPGFQPAELARQAAGYTGQFVYDNYAIFEVPISVSADAKVGDKQPVALDLRFDIYDGTTAQPIGRFFDRARAEVEIGRVLDPAIQGGDPRQDPESMDAPPPPAGEVPAGDTVPVPSSAEQKVIQGQEPKAPDAPHAVTPSTADPATAWTPPAQDDGMPWLVWFGAGAFLLVIGLMVARRK